MMNGRTPSGRRASQADVNLIRINRALLDLEDVQRSLTTTKQLPAAQRPCFLERQQRKLDQIRRDFAALGVRGVL